MTCVADVEFVVASGSETIEPIDVAVTFTPKTGPTEGSVSETFDLAQMWLECCRDDLFFSSSDLT